MGVCGVTAETKKVEGDKINQEGAEKVHQEVEEMIPKNIQSPQAVVESKARHQQGPVATGLAANTTPQSRIHKKLGNPAWVLDERVFFDDVIIVILKRILKRIGIGEEDQQGND